MNPHLPPELFPLLAERLGWALLHSVWQGALAAAALALALPFLRTATARHGACLLALLSLAAAVAVTFARHRPTPSSANPPALMPTTVETQIFAAPLASSPTPSSRRERLAPSVLLAAGQERWLSSWRAHLHPALPWVSAVWLVGVALLTLRHGVGWQRIRAMRRTGVAARPELQRVFARLLEKFECTAGTPLLESAHVAAPMLAGLMKPAVLLPLRVVTGLHPCEIEAILAHELAHLVRRDAWSHLAQIAIETLLFYHPAVWWIGRRARQERENAADDLALAVCTDRRVYAGALAQLAELQCAAPSALAATGGSVLARIQRIVRPERVASPAAGWSLCVPPLLAALALALTTLFQAEAQTAKPAAAAEESVKANAAKRAADGMETFLIQPGDVIAVPQRQPLAWTARNDAELRASIEQSKSAFLARVGNATNRWNVERGMRIGISILKSRLADRNLDAAERRLMEQLLAESEASVPPLDPKVEAMIGQNKQRARARAAEDDALYSPEQRREIEVLYETATRNRRTPEPHESLKRLHEEFGHANRTGCAELDRGEKGARPERIHSLIRSVEEFSGCFYPDGCQVGGYGRYLLADTHWNRGEEAQARQRLDELKANYADSTDHYGQPINRLVEELEVKWAAEK